MQVEYILYFIHNNCTHVIASCKDGDLKLVGGKSENEGRLEVCFDQRWGTINGDGWTHTDTQVACRQLGYSTSGILVLLFRKCTPTWSCSMLTDITKWPTLCEEIAITLEWSILAFLLFQRALNLMVSLFGHFILHANAEIVWTETHKHTHTHTNTCKRFDCYLQSSSVVKIKVYVAE